MKYFSLSGGMKRYSGKT